MCSSDLNHIVELDDLPEWDKIERVFKIFRAFGIELAEQAWGVELAERLDLLNSPNLVVQACRIINALESFGLKLFFETSLLLALIRECVHSFVGDSSRHHYFTPEDLSISFSRAAARNFSARSGE